MPSGQPPTSCLQSSNEDDATGAVEPENAGDSADFARPPISGDCGDLARIKALVPKPLGQDAIPTSRESGTEYRSRECSFHTSRVIFTPMISAIRPRMGLRTRLRRLRSRSGLRAHAAVGASSDTN
jgi:hypothetical protein